MLNYLCQLLANSVSLSMSSVIVVFLLSIDYSANFGIIWKFTYMFLDSCVQIIVSNSEQQ